MVKRLFYRVANIKTEQGLWYDINGNFTGYIHTKFDFCTNHSLPMPFDINIVGWLSATDSLEDLFNWFTKDDICKLQNFDYSITIYEAHEYRFHNNHWIINQKTSLLKEVLKISDIENF